MLFVFVLSDLSLFLFFFFFFFFNAPATTEIYTLSLHDALPICTTARPPVNRLVDGSNPSRGATLQSARAVRSFSKLLDRKSTRLNSSHVEISYAVFCLKKKKKKVNTSKTK